MQGHATRIRIVAATGVLAAAVLATGSVANNQTPTDTKLAPAKAAKELVRLQSTPDGADVYIWTVNGVQRGVAFQ